MDKRPISRQIGQNPSKFVASSANWGDIIDAHRTPLCELQGNFFMSIFL